MLRHVRCLSAIVAALGAVPCIAADADEVRSVAAIEQLGGHVSRNSAGQVISVDLRNGWLTDADLELLAGLPALENINLSYTKVGDLGLEELKPLANVKTLNLYYVEYVTDLGIAHLKHWKNLEYLNVRGTKVTSTLFEHIAKMSKLRFLDVGHSRVNDDLFENLANLDRLEHFSFGGNKMSGAALPLLKELPALRSLSVAGNQRTDSGLWNVTITDFNIDAIAQLTGLESLDLGDTPLTDRGIAKLATLKKLHTLDLHGTRVTSKGLAPLAALPITHLKLWRASSIDDAAIPVLLKMERLETLELPETAVTFAGLMKLNQTPSLKHLHLGGLDLTPDQLDSLRAALPQCRISWWPKTQIDTSTPRGGR